MTSRFVALAVTTITLSALAGRAEAQGARAHFGPHVAYNFDVKEAGIGLQAGLPLASHLEFYPSADWYLVDKGSLVGFNADLKYRVSGAELNWMYLGGGLNLMRAKADGGPSNTDARANVFIGAETSRGAIHPFVELRAMLGSQSSVQVATGLNFTLSGAR